MTLKQLFVQLKLKGKLGQSEELYRTYKNDKPYIVKTMTLAGTIGFTKIIYAQIGDLKDVKYKLIHADIVHKFTDKDELFMTVKTLKQINDYS